MWAEQENIELRFLSTFLSYTGLILICLGRVRRANEIPVSLP